MSLLCPILKHAIFSPRQVAIVDDQRTYTYARLAGAVLHLADHIERNTAAKNVGLMLPTSGAFAASLLGTWMLGKVAVPLNYLLSPDELAYVIRDSDIDTLLTVTPLLDHVGGESVIPKGIRIIKLDELDFTGFPTPRWPAPLGDDDLATILYTSGTSGKPKGVMLSHGNLTADVTAAVEHANIRRSSGFLGILPQFHSFGLTALTLMPLYIGAKVVYAARFNPRQIVSLIRKHKPEIFMAVPSMYGALLSVKSAKPEDFASIRLPISGGEPLPQAVYDDCQQRLGIKILEGYGLTETSPATHWSTPQDHKLHSVGKSFANVQTLIASELGDLLPPNTEGEILLAGPVIMQGYYKLPERTAEVMTQVTLPSTGQTIRAFRTGDIGKVDEDGYLYITGRKKEMLIIGGENVFPREIEEILNQHPSVRDSAVVGKTDGMRGEVPVAFIELNDDCQFDEADLRSFCRDRLAQYKVPREVKVMDELPRSGMGKILRRHLKCED